MAETTAQDRLQPFLLDRLTDEEPLVKQERADRRTLTGRRFRDSVLRDLTWLLNAKSHPRGDMVNEYPDAAKSVLNFGMPDLTGLTASGVSPEEIERMVRAAILQFEPRINRATLSVRVFNPHTASGSAAQKSNAPGNIIALEIKGEIRIYPMSEPLYVKTSVDLETGHCELKL